VRQTVEPVTQPVCAEFRGKSAKVRREAVRTRLHGIHEIGLEHPVVDR
jgi:hypothetical protein